jgi:predicted secreted hydrolase
VMFRAERGSFPVSWASHVALTDERGGRFLYDQRSEIGPQVDLDAGRALKNGYIFNIRGSDDHGAPSDAEPWKMLGGFGRDIFEASTDDFKFTLIVDDDRDAIVLHDEDGWIDFGPAGGSYYYSRPRMTASGDLTIDGEVLPVEGTAWFDHQWGDFIAVGGGGWDWFAVNLDDGTDLTVSLVRAADGSYPLVYGTLVRPDGSYEHLPRDAFSVTPNGSWTSERTGAVYPSGWTISVPAEELTINLTPTVADQELDTRATTGVVYWEGSQEVVAARAGQPLSGEAYVELTGYAATR